MEPVIEMVILLPWKAGAHLSLTANTMAAVVWAKQGTRASAVKVSVQLAHNIQVST